MILLDAYALVALLRDEPAAEDVERLIKEEETAATAVNLAEAVEVAQRVHGLALNDVEAALEPLFPDTVDLLSVQQADAWRAAEIRVRHYHRSQRPLSLADCFLLAASGSEDAIATSDPAVAETARLEQLGVVALPDSSGHLP